MSLVVLKLKGWALPIALSGVSHHLLIFKEFFSRKETQKTMEIE